MRLATSLTWKNRRYIIPLLFVPLVVSGCNCSPRLPSSVGGQQEAQQDTQQEPQPEKLQEDEQGDLQELQQELQEGRATWDRTKGRLDTLLQRADITDGGDFVAFTRLFNENDPIVRQTLLEPLNAQFQMYKANYSIADQKLEDQGYGGLVIGVLPCFVEKGDVVAVETDDLFDCVVSGETVPPIPLRMIATLPVEDKGPIIPELGKKTRFQFVTEDKNETEGPQVYFFNNPTFTPAYFAAAVNATAASAIFTGDPIALGQALARCGLGGSLESEEVGSIVGALLDIFGSGQTDKHGNEFFCHTAWMASEVGDGGLTLLQQILGPFLKEA